MKNKTTTHQNAWLGAVAAAVLAIAAAPAAQAQVRITEVAPWGSGNSPYKADWFELTNTGSTALSISGWSMDDNSNGTAKVALTGISSIAAGESVIFMEGTSSLTASFMSTWFGANAPAGLKIGFYNGSGVGLSTDGDAVNVFNGSGALQAKVTFGASDSSSPYQTFDNSQGLNNTTISQLSAVGVNGAFGAKNDAGEIGSPGVIAAAPVPEPSTYALMLGGLLLVGAISRKRKV